MKILTYLLAAIVLLPGIAMATEEPKFEVLERHDDYEIRVYDSYIVAEVVVDASFKDAGNRAFRILADYIFGSNTTRTKMEMTAPVESQNIDSSVRMAMTAPVLSVPEDEAGERYRYAFVIERRYDLDSVPKPIDDRITLRTVEPRTVAVRRFSGSWGQANYEKNRDVLMDALHRTGVTPVSEPYLARYDAPFVPWFMRRNEVLVEVAPPT